MGLALSPFAQFNYSTSTIYAYATFEFWLRRDDIEGQEVTARFHLRSYTPRYYVDWCIIVRRFFSLIFRQVKLALCCHSSHKLSSSVYFVEGHVGDHIHFSTPPGEIKMKLLLIYLIKIFGKLILGRGGDSGSLLMVSARSPRQVCSASESKISMLCVLFLSKKFLPACMKEFAWGKWGSVRVFTHNLVLNSGYHHVYPG